MGIAIILLGPPAAGKGTQAWRLQEEFGFPHVSTGNMLRESLQEGSAVGVEARRYMEAGDLVPDSLVDQLVRGRLSRPDCAGGFVLDGYPRTIPQARFLESLCAGSGFSVTAIMIRVSDEVLIERILSRWTCGTCGKVFGAGNRPDGNVCDACGSPLIHRRDDSRTVFAERLEVYRRETEPLIEHYRDGKGYAEVNGETGADEIYRQISGIVRARIGSGGADKR